MSKKHIKTAGDIVDMFGGQTAMAHALSSVPGLRVEVTQKTCRNWVGRDSIPGAWVLPIYLAAKSRKIGGITMTILIQHAARPIMSADAIAKGTK